MTKCRSLSGSRSSFKEWGLKEISPDGSTCPPKVPMQWKWTHEFWRAIFCSIRMGVLYIGLQRGEVGSHFLAKFSQMSCQELVMCPCFLPGLPQTVAHCPLRTDVG